MHSWILSQRNENKCSQRNLCMIHSTIIQFSSVAQLCLFATPRTAARQASLSITNSWSLLKLMSIKSVMPSNHLLLSHPLLPSVFPRVRVFSNESALASSGQSIGASASASVLPVHIQGWFPLGLTVFVSFCFVLGLTSLISLQSKGLSSLLQHHSLKASILQHSAFMVQLSHP